MAHSSIAKQPFLKMLGLGGLTALFLVVGCETAPTPTASPAPATGVHPGKLTIMLPELGNERFDFAFGSAGAGDGTYARLLHGFLLETNRNKVPLPGIAKEWSLSRDARTWTFTIRDGVKWHDGSDLTLEDVLWTFKHHFGPQAAEYSVAGMMLAQSRIFESLQAIGPDTLSYRTKEPGEYHLADNIVGTGGRWPSVLPKRNEVGDGPEAAAYDRNPVGAGPMRLVSHIRGSAMRFERFDDFYSQPKYGLPEDRRMNFQSLDLVLVPDEATRVAAVRAGEADIIPVSLASRRTLEEGGGRLVLAPESAFSDVRLLGCWGVPVYPCHDQRVRQALDYAIDKELMARTLWGDVFKVKGWNQVTPSAFGYTPELDPRPFDPDKARQLLAEAGYPGGKGFGPLIVNVWPSGDMPFLVESALVAADFWRRELGLVVELRVGDRSVISERERTGQLRGQVLWRENIAKIDGWRSLQGYGNPNRGERRFTDDLEVWRRVREANDVTQPPDQLKKNVENLYLYLRDLNYELGIGYMDGIWGVGPRVVTWEPDPITTYASALYTVTLRQR